MQSWISAVCSFVYHSSSDRLVIIPIVIFKSRRLKCSFCYQSYFFNLIQVTSNFWRHKQKFQKVSDYITPQVCSRSSLIQRKSGASDLPHNPVGLVFHIKYQWRRSWKVVSHHVCSEKRLNFVQYKMSQSFTISYKDLLLQIKSSAWLIIKPTLVGLSFFSCIFLIALPSFFYRFSSFSVFAQFYWSTIELQ